MLCAALHFNPTCGAGGIASAIVVERKTQLLRRIQQGGIPGNDSALALRMQKCHARHPYALLMMRDGLDRHRRVWTALESYVLVELVAEELHAALHQHRGAGHERAVAGSLNESAEL